MKSRYKCIKDRSFGYFLIFVSLVILFFVYVFPFLINDKINVTGLIISSLIALSTIGFFIWIWTTTNYTINTDTLKIKSGPLFWNVPISEISTIRLNQKTFGGTWKPTLSWNSIEIKYRKYSSVFISPENQDTFLNQLKKTNYSIVIKEK